MKGQITDGKKIFAKHVSEIGLVSKVLNNNKCNSRSLKLSNKTTQLKMGTIFGHIIKEEIRVASARMKDAQHH